MPELAAAIRHRLFEGRQGGDGAGSGAGPRKAGREDVISGREALVLAYSGRLQQARRSAACGALAQRAAQPERAALYETAAALREAFFGNIAFAPTSALAALAHSQGREVEYGAAFALALSGDSARANALADDLERHFPEDTAVRLMYLPPLRCSCLNRGDPPRPSSLQPARRMSSACRPASLRFLRPALSDLRARPGLLAAHQGAEAAAEFQKILDHRGIVVSDPIGALARLQLGRAFVLSGD